MVNCLYLLTFITWSYVRVKWNIIKPRQRFVGKGSRQLVGWGWLKKVVHMAIQKMAVAKGYLDIQRHCPWIDFGHFRQEFSN